MIWSLLKKSGDTLLSINSFSGGGLVYDTNGLPVAGTFSSWVNDIYTSGGVEGWVVDGFSVAAHPLLLALQNNDARTLFSMILDGGDSIAGTDKSDLLDGFDGRDQVDGEKGNDTLFGSAGADKLFGGSGNDTLSGGAGKDRLTGEAGSDKFLFEDALKPGNADTITDFDVSSDRIDLSAKVFSGLAGGKLSGNAFAIGTAASDRSDRIIYDDATGNLFFDADGSRGNADLQLFATLDAGLGLNAGDFRIVDDLMMI